MGTTSEPRVIAVVPLFRPDTTQLDRLSELASQVHHVVAVDDGSAVPSPERVEIDPRSVTMVRMSTNGGIARSLNEGIRHARDLGATHVLTMDQDSGLSPDYVARAIEVLRRAESAGIPIGGAGAGMIGPHRLEGDEVLPGLRNGSRGIQSGWLLPVDVFDSLGAFDEDLFIDCVDVDFSMRLETAGRPVLVSDDLAIDHALGDNERTLRVLGRRIAFSYHPPFRRYYITRNRFLMLRRHGLRHPGPMIEQFLLSARIALLCLCFGARRRAQVVAICAGTADAFARRRGRIRPRTEHLIRRVSA